MSTILAKCIWVVFGKRVFVWPNRLYLAKSVLFGKSGLYLAKVGCIWRKWVVFGQNAWVVFFQNWCYLAKMCCISSQQVVFGHNGLPLGIRPNITNVAKYNSFQPITTNCDQMQPICDDFDNLCERIIFIQSHNQQLIAAALLRTTPTRTINQPQTLTHLGSDLTCMFKYIPLSESNIVARLQRRVNKSRD